jgi:TolB-like protein
LEAHRVERKLSAIFAADVEGYSRLMGQDEVGTLRTLTAYRVIIDHLIASHRGRIFTTAGDSVLADFASAVDAVECAVEVQEAVGKENADRPAGEQMRFRIGIHVGDIIVQGDNLFGDAVNIAARLEALAEPGGICVSGTVQDHIGTKLPVGFIDIGEQQVKNITQPIKAYRIRGETSPTAAQVVGTSLPLPDKPSIAVLPFANMSGDPDQEYFADGMVEEIITALSRIRWLFVIARNSSFTYKGHAVDVKQVGRELGVRYVLEGSVRKAGGRVRITGQLINATTGTHIWADRFDGSLADVFDLQDQIATSVAGVIEPTLRQAEIERARRKRPDSLDAYDLYLRALPFAYTSMPEDADKALGYLEQAIRLDADFAVVHAIIAWCHEQRYLRGGLDESAKAIALRHAHLAIAMGGDDPTALAIAGLVTGFLEPREYDVAVSAFDRALTYRTHQRSRSVSARSPALGMPRAQLLSSKPKEHCGSALYSTLCPKSVTWPSPSRILSLVASRNRPPQLAGQYKLIRVSAHPTGCVVQPSQAWAALTKPKLLQSNCSRYSLNSPSARLSRLHSRSVKYSAR